MLFTKTTVAPLVAQFGAPKAHSKSYIVVPYPTDVLFSRVITDPLSIWNAHSSPAARQKSPRPLFQPDGFREKFEAVPITLQLLIETLLMADEAAPAPSLKVCPSLP